MKIYSLGLFWFNCSPFFKIRLDCAFQHFLKRTLYCIYDFIWNEASMANFESYGSPYYTRPCYVKLYQYQIGVKGKLHAERNCSVRICGLYRWISTRLTSPLLICLRCRSFAALWISTIGWFLQLIGVSLFANVRNIWILSFTYLIHLFKQNQTNLLIKWLHWDTIITILQCTKDVIFTK